MVQTIFFIDYSWREEKVVFAVLKIMRGGVLYKEGVCIFFYKRGLVFYKKGKGSFKNSKNLFLLQEWFLVRSTIGNHGFSMISNFWEPMGWQWLLNDEKMRSLGQFVG